MKKGFDYSDRILIAAVLAIGLSGVLAWARSAAATSVTETRRRGAELESALGAQIAAKAEFDHARLESLKADVRRFRSHLGSKEAWQHMTDTLGKRWICEDIAREDSGGYSLQSGSLSMLSPLTADWPQIMDALKTISEMPGVSLVEIRVRSKGGREGRTLESVKIRVAVRSNSEGGKSITLCERNNSGWVRW